MYCKPSPVDKQFCMENAAIFSKLHISLFKIIERKYFSQRKCELLIFLFVLLDKIKILPLETAYFPHQLLYMLYQTPLRNL
jgi:hypothetical protein